MELCLNSEALTTDAIFSQTREAGRLGAQRDRASGARDSDRLAEIAPRLDPEALTTAATLSQTREAGRVGAQRE